MRANLDDQQLDALIDLRVKILPHGRYRNKGGPTVATLKKIDGKHAIVIPSGHRRREQVPKEKIAFWAKGAGERPERYEKIKHLFESAKQTQSSSASQTKPLSPQTKETPVTSATQAPPNQIGKSSSTGSKQETLYVLYHPTRQLFKAKQGFSSELKDARVYISHRTAKIAAQLVGTQYRSKGGSRKQRNGVTAWSYLLDNQKLAVATLKEAQELAKQWARTPSVLLPGAMLTNPYWKPTESAKSKKAARRKNTGASIRRSSKNTKPPAEIAKQPESPVLESKPNNNRAKLLARWCEAHRAIAAAEILKLEEQIKLINAECELTIARKLEEFGS